MQGAGNIVASSSTTVAATTIPLTTRLPQGKDDGNDDDDGKSNGGGGGTPSAATTATTTTTTVKSGSLNSSGSGSGTVTSIVLPILVVILLMLLFWYFCSQKRASDAAAAAAAAAVGAEIFRAESSAGAGLGMNENPLARANGRGADGRGVVVYAASARSAATLDSNGYIYDHAVNKAGRGGGGASAAAAAAEYSVPFANRNSGEDLSDYATPHSQYALRDDGNGSNVQYAIPLEGLDDTLPRLPPSTAFAPLGAVGTVDETLPRLPPGAALPNFKLVYAESAGGAGGHASTYEQPSEEYSAQYATPLANYAIPAHGASRVEVMREGDGTGYGGGEKAYVYQDGVAESAI